MQSPPRWPWTLAGNHVTLVVRLTPKGGRDSVDGIDRLADGSAVLKVRVRAPPSEGEANAALVRLIAKTLAVPARDVAIVAGGGARIKRLAISGDGPTLIAALERASIGQ